MKRHALHRVSLPVNRPGFSLTELLVAMTIALMVMGSVASLFGVFGRGLSGSQATVELSSRVRAASWQLRKDLAGVTCDVVPWLSPEADAGYFEYIEGPRNDKSAAHATANIEADIDDVLLFTARSIESPFVGTVVINGTATGTTAESDRAEIAWFCREASNQPVAGTKLYNLYRRQLLVSAVPGSVPFSEARISGTVPTSPWSTRAVAISGSWFYYPNSLGDLTKREHRFMRSGTTAISFPYVFTGTTSHLTLATGTNKSQLPSLLEGLTFDPVESRDDDADGFTDEEDEVGPRTGDDVVLTNVIAFDVRAYDPQAGGYIDLGVGGTGVFAAAPATKSGLAATPTYDTWSTHYEFANPPAAGTSDPGLYATAPPYPVPLRGIEVRIRCYEPTSKQIRQITVRHTFVKK